MTGVRGHRVKAVEAARLHVVALVDRALADGVPEAEVDAALARFAAEKDPGDGAAA